MTTLYGINNCDTVKKARNWLEANNRDYTFHDFRTDGITAAQVQYWVETLGWEILVNKRSTTWKQLDEDTKLNLNNSSVVDVILASPTLIKRPLLELNGALSVGFKAADYEHKFL